MKIMIFKEHSANAEPVKMLMKQVNKFLEDREAITISTTTNAYGSLVITVLYL